MTVPARRTDLIAPVRDASLLSVSVPAAAAALSSLRRLLGAFAELHGAGPELLAAVELSVTEAAANVVRHAYPPHAPGALHVAADTVDGALEIVIADDGCGLREGGSTGGAGLGLGLIARNASRVKIGRRQPRGTEVWMRFELAR